MRILMLIFITSVVAGCNDNHHPDSVKNKDTLSDEKRDNLVITKPILKPRLVTSGMIIDSLSSFPFVKEANLRIDSFSHHKRGIAFMTDTLENNLLISCGYNGPEHFETYYFFKVIPGTYSIQVQDIVSGEWLSTAAFSKLQQQKER